MNNYYLTFGQNHPKKLGWIRVQALNYSDARSEVLKAYGKAWAFLYEEDKFEPEFFPQGEYGILRDGVVWKPADKL